MHAQYKCRYRARTANKWWCLALYDYFLSEKILHGKHLTKGASCCLYCYVTNTHSVTVSLPFNLKRPLSLSISHTRYTNTPISLKTWILETEASGIFFFHNLPQTSSNLSFSLQWSNGDVCSLLVQLNFKKLYAHAEYHYWKHNYHKVFLPSVALLSLCVIVLTYSVADIYSVSTEKSAAGKCMSFWKLGCHCLITGCGGMKSTCLLIFTVCFCVYRYMCSCTHRCTD